MLGRPLPRSLLLLVLTLIPSPALADPATLSFTDCFSDSDSTSQKLNVNTVYGQVLRNDQWGHYLNLTVLGDSPNEIVGVTSTSGSLATLFTTTTILTLNAFTNSSYVCTTLRPPSPLPQITANTSTTPAPTFCPIPAGPFALSSTIPLGNSRALTTLSTRLRAVDPFGNELVCIDVLTSPLDPAPENPYGLAVIIFWGTVGLTILYWIVVGTARIVAAWGRGLSRRGIWARVESAGFILASAISGERLASSPALMRFCTPSMRDIMFHTQWCAILAMVAVEWPPFVYPLLTQAAWATLQYNITLYPAAADHHWNPLTTLPFSPPSNFADQIADTSSPLYINTTASNILFTLPQNASDGVESFAYALGVRPRDLFPNFHIIFFGIAAAVIVVSCLIWAVDLFSTIIAGKVSGNSGGYSETRSLGVPTLSRTKSPLPGSSSAKEMGEAATPSPEEAKILSTQASFPSSQGHRSRFALPLTSPNPNSERGINSHRSWWRVRTDISSFHSAVLHGNLVRLLVLFHLPLTVFSSYQMTRPRGPDSPLNLIIAAAFSFVLISVLLPLHLVLRVRFTSTNKLYDETRTLLSYGPLYNHYRHGSQMFAGLFFCTNLAFGIVIGAGQKSGTAQAIVILVVEVISALVTSVWLPWGSGASMGLISFLFCVARIVIAVLLVILTPAISIGVGAGGWVSYGILVILALVYLALLLMLVVKLVEAIVRIIGGIGFDRSKHVVDSGLLGACGLLGCCGGPRKRRHRRSKGKRPPESDTINLQQQSPSGRNSESSYVPPGAPGFLSVDSRKGSTHSGQPPSVLRPELVNRPYREDSEDEGFIMGAWQRFPRTAAGYTPVGSDANVSPPKPSSGFSRVGGGRAHIDSPYAITAPGNAVMGGNSSTHTFPSIGQQSGPLSSPVFYEDDDDPPPSLSSVARQPEIGTLPPGAMHPAHVRTKSQTAIIEDAGGMFNNPVMSPPSGGMNMARQHRASSSSMTAAAAASGSANPLLKSGNKFILGSSSAAGHGDDEDDDDDDDDESQQPKKKAWFPFRRSRPQSSEGRSQQPSSAVDEEFGGLGTPAGGMASAQPQRSFVVIRKAQPQGGSTSRLNQGSS